jgi:hypothetical protein
MPWQHNAMDRINLRAIHKAYGRRPLKGYRTVSFLDFYLVIPVLHRIKFYRPLNLIPYDKDEAIAALETVGWKRYARKHGESEFTKFFQDYYLPVKFGIDKRRTHLSGIILSGAITRDQALAQLQQPNYDEDSVHRDIEYFCKKIGVDQAEFDEVFARNMESLAGVASLDEAPDPRFADGLTARCPRSKFRGIERDEDCNGRWRPPPVREGRSGVARTGRCGGGRRGHRPYRSAL